jgi:hypothetical protein
VVAERHALRSLIAEYDIMAEKELERLHRSTERYLSKYSREKELD